MLRNPARTEGFTTLVVGIRQESGGTLCYGLGKFGLDCFSAEGTSLGACGGVGVGGVGGGACGVGYGTDIVDADRGTRVDKDFT